MVMVPPPKGDSRYTDYVIELAKTKTPLEGVINEPRIFFDEIPLNADPNVVVPGTAGVMVNGEQFPVRITHMVACMRYLEQDDDTVADQQEIGRVLLNLKFHDQYYMNSFPLPVPVWGNKAVAAPEAFSASNAHWDLVQNSRPFVMAARDTVEVQVRLRDAADPAAAVPVDVVLHGFGMLSKRPYILNGHRDVANLTLTALGTVDFRNDGSEPIVITDVTANVGGLLNSIDPLGNINRVSINIRQRGNGTGSWWFIGPTAPPVVVAQMQATLLGVTAGRAVVHQLPGDGLIWNPGDGMTILTRAAVADLAGVLCIGFAGYIMVR
jgi:hypothetical protein